MTKLIATDLHPQAGTMCMDEVQVQITYKRAGYFRVQTRTPVKRGSNQRELTGVSLLTLNDVGAYVGSFFEMNKDKQVEIPHISFNQLQAQFAGVEQKSIGKE